MTTFTFSRTIRKSYQADNQLPIKAPQPTPGTHTSFTIARPTLTLHRYDTAQLARFWSLPVCIDASNQSLEIERNKVRHRLLPFLRKEFNADIDRTLFHFSLGDLERLSFGHAANVGT